ncbi:MAG: phage/plasmid primase, P4 family [Candidatus Hodarchaeota archaeon]
MATKKSQLKKAFDVDLFFQQNDLTNDTTLLDLVVNNATKPTILNHLKSNYTFNGNLLSNSNCEIVYDYYLISHKQTIASIKNQTIQTKRQGIIRSGYAKAKTKKTKTYLSQFYNLRSIPWWKTIVDQLDELFYNEKENTKQLAMSELGTFLQTELTMYGIEHTTDDRIYYYDLNSGVYLKDGNRFARKVARNLFPQINRYYLKELICFIKETQSKLITDFNYPPFRALNNGLLNTEALDFVDFNPDHLITNKMPVTHDPDIECPYFEDFIENSIPDGDDRTTLLEFMGSTLEYGYKFHNMLMLYGPRNAGKGTTLNVFEEVFGKDNCAGVHPDQLIKNFNNARALFGKMVNFAGDIESKPIAETSIIKRLVGYDTVAVDIKYMNEHLRFKNQAKLVLSANKLPLIFDDSGATQAKVLLVHYPYGHSDDMDVNLLSKLITEEEKTGILNLLLENLKNLNKRGNFLSEFNGQSFSRYERASNTVQTFLEEDSSIQFDENNEIPKLDLYIIYDDFCRTFGYEPESQISFGRKLYSYCKKKNIKIKASKKANKTKNSSRNINTYRGITYNKYDDKIMDIKARKKAEERV